MMYLSSGEREGETLSIVSDGESRGTRAERPYLRGASLRLSDVAAPPQCADSD